eukprot:9307592-Pyramimonas_sp.AAC.1
MNADGRMRRSALTEIIRAARAPSNIIATWAMVNGLRLRAAWTATALLHAGARAEQPRGKPPVTTSHAYRMGVSARNPSSPITRSR